MFHKKTVLTKVTIFTGKHLCWSLFLILIERRLQRRCFSVNVVKFLRTFTLKQLYNQIWLFYLNLKVVCVERSKTLFLGKICTNLNRSKKMLNWVNKCPKVTLVIKHSTSQNDPKPTKTIKYFAQIFNIVKGYHKLSSAEKPYYFQWDAYLRVAHNRWWGLKENIRLNLKVICISSQICFAVNFQNEL